ncbi:MULTISPECIES: MFS transporter [Microbacterium]|uniref:MFS transporter n=1 Tax=Microbacterium wangchenii TaxID=2541726 RepID=A0ABX5STZ6_9MICO|nr:MULTISPECIES: MFS transporter [Microbacterium]MCK6065220.1 MHS family MFS transporter [Microbacterium sp. EYE_512]QBR88671.1 MFS transporter [Microbacterium wangchenii]TXK20395.1 MHS family MFS transporter [Microbacterium wangchenii]
MSKVAQQEPTDLSRRDSRRTLMASTVGTVLEWYDFNLYGLAAALVFGPLMFGESGIGGTLAAFASLGVGFLARPIGGFVLGNLGDKIGRKPILMFTFITMGLSSALIGLLPTNAQIGIWAPILLVFLRIVQGFAVGGEFAGATLMTMENAPIRRRGVFGALPSMGTGAGFVLATIVFALVSALPNEAFLAWGWRIPFLASVVLVVFGVIIRSRLPETRAFSDIKEEEKESTPVLTAFTKHPTAILRTIGLVMGGAVWGYLIQTFSLSYGTAELGMDRTILLWAIGIAAALEMATIPFWGWLSDKVGRKRVIITGVILTALFVFPFFWLFNTREPWLVFLAVVIGLPVLKDMIFGPQAAFAAEMFSSNVRYSGVSAGRELGGAIFGGTAPFIATMLIALGGGIWPLAIYIILTLAITGFTVLTAPNNQHKDLREI